MLEVCKIVCEDRYSVQEQLKNPESPSKTYSREAHPQDVTAPPASEVGRQRQKRKPRIVAFFAQKRTDVSENMLEEVRIWAAAQNKSIGKEEVSKEIDALPRRGVERLDLLKTLMLGFEHQRSFCEVDIHAKPTFENFTGSMLVAKEKNTRIVHSSGHNTSRCGFFCLKNRESTAYEQQPIATFAKIFETVQKVLSNYRGGGTIECVILNASETEEVGKRLLELNAPSLGLAIRSKGCQ
jgi:hypothetical protein